VSDTPDDFEEFAEPDDPGYGMIMPFLPVQSKGGPHDDNAWVAGYEMGQLDAMLGGAVFDQGQAIRRDNREQADLIAMKHGFVAEFFEYGEEHGEEVREQWIMLRIRRAVQVPE
jgi:hypothetical protein